MTSPANSPATLETRPSAILECLPASGPARAQRPMAAIEALRMVQAQRLVVRRIAIGVHAVATADAGRLVTTSGTVLTFSTPRPQATQASHVLAAAWTLGEGLSAAVSRAFATRRFVLAQLLDDLGTVLLFRLAERLFARAARRAARSGLGLGPVMAPGDGALGLDMLAPALALAGAGRAGIRVVAGGAMWPAKSGTALALLGSGLQPGHAGWDCATCQSADSCRLRRQ